MERRGFYLQRQPRKRTGADSSGRKSDSVRPVNPPETLQSGKAPAQARRLADKPLREGQHAPSARFPWPPDIEGLETPEFLLTARGDFPPQEVIDREREELRLALKTNEEEVAS